MDISATPWVWYISRTAGLIGYIFLWLTIFFGLAIRNPLLKKYIEPFYSFDWHCFLAAGAVFWALVHGTSFLWHGAFSLTLTDIAIPLLSKTTLVNVNYLALGTMAFYLMIVITATSYLRRHMTHGVWRILHFLNPLAFIFVVLHGYLIGTDMKNFYIGGAFLASSFVLLGIYLLSLVSAILKKLQMNNNQL